jgi:hypothetical protein
VIPENEVDGPPYCGFYFLKMRNNGRSLADIAGDENRFGASATQSAQEKLSSSMVEEFHVNVVNPDYLHVPPLAPPANPIRLISSCP